MHEQSHSCIRQCLAQQRGREEQVVIMDPDKVACQCMKRVLDI